MREYDLVVIGGGSAGLKAARTAARLGRKVALAEERELGGECFWAGCVPTKAMVRAAQVWHMIGRASEFGVDVRVSRADFRRAMQYRDRVIARVAGDGPADGGLSRLGADFFPMRAVFESSNRVRIGEEIVGAKQIAIATGTYPTAPPIPGMAEAGYITNREAVTLTTLPERLVVLGAGPIGMEFAQIFRRFGAEVTVIERLDRVLGSEDAEISALAERYLGEEGIRILTGTTVERVEGSGANKLLHVAQGAVRREIRADTILVATGRAPAIDGLNVEALGLRPDRGLVTDAYLRTEAKHVWAAGDVRMGYLFTHVASYEGRLAAMNAFTDRPEPFDHRVVPRCTYIDPEVASIGLTERQAIERGLRVVTQRFSFADLDRAIIFGDARGIVKLVYDELDGQLVGAHLIGPDASSIVAEVALCMKGHLPISAIADTMHAYPSFPEAVEAAALSAPNYRGQVEGATGG